MQKIGFVGAGHIAEAIIRGLITSGYVDPGQISISDVDAQRLRKVNETLGPAIVAENGVNAKNADILFLAVKPNQVVRVGAEIRPMVRSGQVVISVAAGCSVAKIRDAIGAAPTVCRIMPNLAAAVRRSIIALYAEPAETDESLAPVWSLLTQLGKVFRVGDERLMAPITALSGSAPAYYVMMADALVQFSVEQGIPQEMAVAMILGAMEGAAAWALNGKVSLDQLWRRVVTPGGTTQAGMAYYDEHGFVETFVEGLRRSTERARQLGDD